jgi:hypothetical protein
MPTEQIVLIALAVNFAIALAAIAIPRIRNRRSRGASSDAASSRRTVTGAAPAAAPGGR